MELFLSSLFRLSLGTLSLFYITTKAGLAKVTSDGTVNTQVNQNGNVAEITGGQRQGGNLFHSFQDFSVSTGNEAFFNNNADNISNIFSRVTGGNISNIDGAIRANGTANLFLINPAGIIFGEDARLDIGGSFYGSTASSILFGDGEFSAVDNLQQPVLTVNAPIGLGFRDESGDIVNRAASDGLTVASGKNISLVGGNVSLENGGITAPGGRVELGGLLETGTIAIAEDNSLSFPENVAKGDVTLSDASRINVTADEGGSVNIDAKNLSMASGSSIFAGIAVDGGILEAQSGDVTIDLEEDLVIDGANGGNTTSGNTTISNSNFGTGNAGNIEINARNVSFINSGAIASFNSGQGSTGDIFVNATGDILFDGVADFRGGINNFSGEEATGSVGNISLQAQNLTITNGANIQSLVAGGVDGGDISIDVVDTISVDGFADVVLADGNSGVLSSSISSGINSDSIVDSGNIAIEAQNLFLSSSGFVDVSVLGQGTAGNITINATDTVSINGAGLTDDAQAPSRISANIGRNSTGDAGNIQINSSQLLITNGSFVAADILSAANGDGGAIDINTTELLSLDNNSYISADILSGASGNGGAIDIDATELSLNNEAFISANIFAEANGDGGTINIDATELSLDNGALISADIFAEANGDGGDININTTRLTASSSFISTDVRTGGNGNSGNLIVNAVQLNLEDGAQISTTTLGSGNAGSLRINASESIRLQGITENSKGGIFASALEENGNGGDINIFTSDLSISDGATIAASNFSSRGQENGGAAPGTGEPGNIFIAADSIKLESEGSIVAATQSSLGDAEDTNIILQVADDITLQGNSFISARAFDQGNGGNLSIDSRFIIAFPSNGNGNDIIASAQQGRGGNININSTLLGIEENVAVSGNDSNNIDASSQFSLDGSITINTPDNNIIQGTIELPNNLVEPGETTAQACQANREATAQNSLKILGKGGIPTAPGLSLSSQSILIGGESNSNSSVPQAVETSQGKIKPARGIRMTESGDVILTAYRTNNLGARLADGKVNCGV